MAGVVVSVVVSGGWCFFPLTRRDGKWVSTEPGTARASLSVTEGMLHLVCPGSSFFLSYSVFLRASHLLLQLQFASMLRFPRSLLWGSDSHPLATHPHKDILQALQTQPVLTEPFAIPTKYIPHLVVQWLRICLWLRA